MINKILNYINDTVSKQAFLINGAWGIGKTYFIQNELIKELRKQKKLVLYYSLFSFNSIMELNKKFYISTLLNHKELLDIKLISEHKKLITCVLNAIFTYAAGNSINAENFYEIETLFNLDNLIIILDDLERSNIKLEDVLGWISNITENHKNFKVIVVADESIILNSQSKNIYTKYKEKIFGPILEYNYSIEKILNNIIDNLTSKQEIKEYLKRQKSLILQIMELNKKTNVRVLIFAISAFVFFYEELKRLKDSNSSCCHVKDDENINENLFEKEACDILKYTIYSAFEIKVKNKKPFKLTETKCGQLWIGEFFNGLELWSYKFVDDYLDKYHFDSMEFNDTIFESIAKKIHDSKESNLALGELCDWRWRDLEDNEINNLLDKLLTELEENKYSKNDYSKIILVLMNLKNNGFNIDYRNYTNIILGYTAKNDLQRKDLQINFQKEKDSKEYESIICDILESIDEKQKEIAINDNVFLSDRKYWQDNFEEKCSEKQKFYIDSKKFFFYINIDILVDSIKESTPKELRIFIKGIKQIYSFTNLNDFYKSDIDKLQKAIRAINSLDINQKGITWRLARTDLLDFLQDSLNKIKT